jgi:predicted MFS family arabinose efflux permease
MSVGTSSGVAEARVRTAARATSVAFIGAGFAFASWASRIPQVRTHLGLSASELGLVLLSIAAGSVIAMPLSGALVNRWTSRRTTAGMSVLLAVAMVGVALGYRVGVVPLLPGLFVLGFANGAWDVSMNVQAAVVEQGLGRAVMSRFHAGYSVGTVGGALVGALMVALDVPVTAHLLGVAVVIVACVPWAVQGYLPDAPGAEEAGGAEAGPRHPLAAWGELRTLLIGVCVLAFAFAEGTANDWIGVALIDGYRTPAAVGTLGLAAFLAAMTAARWFGPPLLDRYGRVPVVRVLAAVNVVGLLLFVFGGATAVAFAGALLWGIGVSLGFPVGMSAAADDPRRAPARVSVVASIGYCAFLGGPPLIGFLGEHVTVLRALVAVAVLLAVAVALAGAFRPLRSADDARG